MEKVFVFFFSPLLVPRPYPKDSVQGSLWFCAQLLLAVLRYMNYLRMNMSGKCNTYFTISLAPLPRKIILEVFIQHVSRCKDILVKKGFLHSLHTQIWDCLIILYKMLLMDNSHTVRKQWLEAIKLNTTTKSQQLRLPKRNVGSHPSY